ncbi:hypothetical protein [Mesorhizobium kowhaii]|uniref:hypothetical protein n=1 Tax=Mesorhizobium kowhaii TaxID=1300272 RepID=UPI00142D20B8|nr:hypothetical protein [Mesorhizobium kowhaii]
MSPDGPLIPSLPTRLRSVFRWTLAGCFGNAAAIAVLNIVLAKLALAGELSLFSRSHSRLPQSDAIGE